MRIRVTPDTYFIFDLDDTLYPERDFLESGYRHIAARLVPVAGRDLYPEMLRRYGNKENVFRWLTEEYHKVDAGFNTEFFLKTYRQHMPDICLDATTGRFLKEVQRLAIPSGIISDGRSVTQRNKLKALGIEEWFQDIIISEEFGSEKPAERNFLYFQRKYPGKDFYYFGDNTVKDFIVPSRLGWHTVCLLDSGRHIHPQRFDRGPFPDFIISSFGEIELSI